MPFLLDLYCTSIKRPICRISGITSLYWLDIRYNKFILIQSVRYQVATPSPRPHNFLFAIQSFKTYVLLFSKALYMYCCFARGRRPSPSSPWPENRIDSVIRITFLFFRDYSFLSVHLDSVYSLIPSLVTFVR